jgi:hypothetical protein
MIRHDMFTVYIIHVNDLFNTSSCYLPGGTLPCWYHWSMQLVPSQVSCDQYLEDKHNRCNYEQIEMWNLLVAVYAKYVYFIVSEHKNYIINDLGNKKLL